MQYSFAHVLPMMRETHDERDYDLDGKFDMSKSGSEDYFLIIKKSCTSGKQAALGIKACR